MKDRNPMNENPRGANPSNNDTPYSRVIMEQLISTFQVASESAFLSVLAVIAERAGIQTLDDGLSVVDSFYRRKTEVAEAAIAEFADFCPTAASDVKALWERLNTEQEQLQQMDKERLEC